MVKRSKKSKRSKGRLRRGATLRSRPRVDRFRAAHPTRPRLDFSDATLIKRNFETLQAYYLALDAADNLIDLANKNVTNYQSIVDTESAFTTISSMLGDEKLRKHGVSLLDALLLHAKKEPPGSIHQIKFYKNVKDTLLHQLTNGRHDDRDTKVAIGDIIETATSFNRDRGVLHAFFDRG